jgi:hypothetical protein
MVLEFMQTLRASDFRVRQDWIVVCTAGFEPAPPQITVKIPGNFAPFAPFKAVLNADVLALGLEHIGKAGNKQSPNVR